MTTDETRHQIASDIWSIYSLLRGPYKRNEQRKGILPPAVLRRFDAPLSSTKAGAVQLDDPGSLAPDLNRTMVSSSEQRSPSSPKRSSMQVTRRRVQSLAPATEVVAA